ncbi:MAG: cytochrome c [Solirubrobacteraceae bacterium]
MRMQLVLGASVLAIAGMLGGCGAGAGSQTASGRVLFAHNCTVCHSLIGNEWLHRQGGDLLGYRFSRQVLRQYTRQMPVGRPLSSGQLGAIVEYVYQAEQRAPAN